MISHQQIGISINFRICSVFSSRCALLS